MNPSVLNDSAVSLDMSVVHRHTIIIWVEDRWLVHIVPSAIQIIRPNKIRSQIQTAPKVLGISVEVINPYRITRPAFALKICQRIWTSNKYIFDISLSLWGILNFLTFRVDEVVFIYVNVRIVDHYKPSLRFSDLLVQLLHLIEWPCFSVKDEVLKILRVIEVGPKYINWESVGRELFVTSHYQVCTVLLPFAIVVS